MVLNHFPYLILHFILCLFTCKFDLIKLSFKDEALQVYVFLFRWPISESSSEIGRGISNSYTHPTNFYFYSPGYHGSLTSMVERSIKKHYFPK